MNDEVELQNFCDQVGTNSCDMESTGGRKLKAPSSPEVVSDSESRPNKDVRAWASTNTVFWGVDKTYSRLPPAMYTTGMSDSLGPYLVKQTVATDDLIHLPDVATERVLEEIRKFSTLKDKFTKMGFLYKRGIMLWGPPGTGKTCCVSQICEIVINDMDGIVIQIENPYVARQCLQLARRIEPTRQILVIMEDIDALMRNYSESEYLALLDGEGQVDNVIFVATTNYPDRLDARLVNRPSRFDSIHYVGVLTAAARRIFIKTKHPEVTDVQLEAYVTATKDMSMAHIKEMLILVEAFDLPMEKAEKKLRALMNSKAIEDPKKSSIGFGFTMPGEDDKADD